MASGCVEPISDNNLIYSIQRTYIINLAPISNALVLTCNQRIDVPVIEPVTNVRAVVYDLPQTVVPCVELKMIDISLEGLNLVFETNEGVTVLPVKIYSGRVIPEKNPYSNARWVLALPRGTTGIKSCKVLLINGATIQHKFTFGIMPPPYNYDNALFGCFSSVLAEALGNIIDMGDTVRNLKLATQTPTFKSIDLYKGSGKQTIDIEDGVLFYNTWFSYPLSPESTIHNPKITLHGGGRDQVYTLSLNKTTNTVSIDLFTGMITVYAGVTGEIIQQFKLAIPYHGFETISFENFDDIDSSYISVTPKGARVI